MHLSSSITVPTMCIHDFRPTILTMTLSDLTSKTPEELNVMCAELCGWHVKITEHFKILSPPSSEFGLCCGLHLDDEEVWQFGLTGDENGNYKFPNYTGSWDAIMPEVRKLNPRRYRGDVPTGQWERYVATLLKVVEYHDVSWAYAEPIHITQALILTLTSQH